MPMLPSSGSASDMDTYTGHATQLAAISTGTVLWTRPHRPTIYRSTPRITAHSALITFRSPPLIISILSHCCHATQTLFHPPLVLVLCLCCRSLFLSRVLLLARVHPLYSPFRRSLLYFMTHFSRSRFRNARYIHSQRSKQLLGVSITTHGWARLLELNTEKLLWSGSRVMIAWTQSRLLIWIKENYSRFDSDTDKWSIYI